jgi:hypothetical protein
MKAYLVDVGVLLTKEDKEFDFYSCVYNHKYGYYDENQYYVSTKEKATKEIKEYVENGVEGTYGIVSLTTLDDSITKQDIDDGNVDVSDEHYKIEDVCVGYAKLNNQVCRII